MLAAISDEERGIFIAMAQMGLRPGEARALTVCDCYNGWIKVDKAIKGKAVSAPVRGTKTGKPKSLPMPEVLLETLAVAFADNDVIDPEHALILVARWIDQDAVNDLIAHIVEAVDH